MFAILDHIDQLTPNIRTYYFRTEKPLRRVAGEFTELHLPHPNTDARGDRRWFTISNSPSEELIAITTQVTPSGSSFKQALLMLKQGDQVSLAEPLGDFVLPKDQKIPLVFVAAGLGITPVNSIIGHLKDTGEHRDVRLVRIVAGASKAIFADQLQKYPMQYDVFDTAVGRRLTAANLRPIIGSDSLVYLSGPERFIEQLATELQQSGVPARHIITDLFPGYAG